MSAPIRPEDFDDAFPVLSLFGASGTGAAKSKSVEAIGFAAGTRVATPVGYVTVERLNVGDRVLTVDGRHAPLVWVGMTRMVARGVNAPVRFETGVMDNIRPLRLGQGHRVRVAGWRAELLYDTDAVLATAKTFINDIDISIDENIDEVTYMHLMFARHEVVLAENVACETLRDGPEGRGRLDQMERYAVDVHHPPMSPGHDGSGQTSGLPVLSPAEEMALRVG